VAVESGKKDSTESMLGTHSLKVWFTMYPSDRMSVSRWDLKHLLLYPCLYARLMPLD